MADDKKIPVTIVTGFLGAGKTTLVNKILRGDHGMKIAVIENEFGEVNIDQALVADNMEVKEDVVTMDNGCVCCTVRGDLVQALEQLLEREKKFDHVLIELTGLADPAPVAFTFFLNSEIGEHYRIDSILCLADSKHIKQHLEEVKADDAVNEAIQQVAFADRILLNKVDLVKPEELADIKETIRSINGFAEVLETKFSQVDLQRVLGVNSFSVEKTLDVDPTFMDELKPAGEVPPTKKKKHDLSGVSSVGVVVEGNMDFQSINQFMFKLLQEKSKDIYRSKGVLSFEGQGNQKFVFQGVHEQMNFGPAVQPWADDEPRVNKMVFIGRNLNRDELEAGVKACLAANK
mmetsp:Transcript_15433/g.50733  ORF Transcript_15433/g.50733 Transcript_15433/m.50733 type:complete len:347 (+) Transcript_15433:35-1075(+)|eukprot:CAMPEP_0170134460 /NCGR_PEP_ID=MMETSP0033_2-20121228/1909_1 /TAXON_ID=195969 /ORGANISM="Dolichomastix tenuilepis, Strain CCMP3274" /LENGTH=346 /DNA_ID=CAMNT_0010370013 /DNA_START=14 /DNA_END=1054 /DNA_ORIENTATION=+